jgi:hypothetical protein
VCHSGELAPFLCSHAGQERFEVALQEQVCAARAGKPVCSSQHTVVLHSDGLGGAPGWHAEQIFNGIAHQLRESLVTRHHGTCIGV